MIVAIDGPVASGKSTVARLIARALGMTYIDTGAMYRAVALGMLERGIGAGDAAAVIAALGGVDVRLAHDPATGEQKVYLDGVDVTSRIRAPNISIGASDVSRIPEVRIRMVALQRAMAADRDVIMDGRDIGTYVFPGADRKYYLTAPPCERARRRYLEQRAGGGDATFEDCLRDLLYRDENDSSRAFAPLAKADDALCVQTGGMSVHEVSEFLRLDITRAGYNERK